MKRILIPFALGVLAACSPEALPPPTAFDSGGAIGDLGSPAAIAPPPRGESEPRPPECTTDTECQLHQSGSICLDGACCLLGPGCAHDGGAE